MSTHGGDRLGFYRKYGRMPLDFSASLNPLGMPEAVREAAKQAVDDAEAYPDPSCRLLREALGEKLGISPGSILCGNGAADLIYRIPVALRAKRGLITAPAFSEYAAAMTAADCRVEEYPLWEEDGFRVTERIIEAIVPGIDLLFLCTPNNPTGGTVDPELVERIAERCREVGAVFVLDQCFLDFVADRERHGLLDLLERFPNLLLLRAFTKSYAMAGLRLGYLLGGDRDLLDKLEQAGQSWSVSTPAQAAGLAALGQESYLEAGREIVFRERSRMAEGLRALGMAVLEPEANFICFRSPEPSLGGRLAERGILIRDCGNFSGMGKGWYRVCVSTPENNGVLLGNIEEAMEKAGRDH